MDSYIERLKRIKSDLREDINAFSGNFTDFKPEGGSRIHFADDDGLDVREVCVDTISSEDGVVTIYPRSKKRPPQQLDTIEDVNDLMTILDIMFEQFKPNEYED